MSQDKSEDLKIETTKQKKQFIEPSIVEVDVVLTHAGPTGGVNDAGIYS